MFPTLTITILKQPFTRTVSTVKGLEVANRTIKQTVRVMNVVISKHKEEMLTIKADIEELKIGRQQSEQRQARLETAQERQTLAVSREVKELRGTLGSVISGFDMDYGTFALPMIKTHLAKLGVSYAKAEMRRLVIDREDPENAIEAGLYSEAPFLIGECTLQLESVAQVHEFLDQAPLIKRAAGRADEAPMLFFFAYRAADRGTRREAIRLLNEAGCHWFIGGEMSKDL